MKTIKFLSLAALALTFAACSNDNDNALVQQPALQVVKGKVTITAQLAPKGAATRAVSDKDDGNITVDWAVNEHLAILYIKDEINYEADATITAVDGTTGEATITFSVEEGTLDNTACTIVYPKSAAKDNHTGVKNAATLLGAQDGTLNDNLDVRVGAGTIKVTTPSLSVTTQPEAQFAIMKLTLADDAKNLSIMADDITIAGATLASAGTEFTVAVPAVSSKTVTIVANDESNNCYYYSKAGVTIAAGKYYQSSPTMTTLGTESSADVYKITATSGVTIPDGKTVVLSGVNISNGQITCGGNTTMILMGTNTVTASASKAAIQIGGSGTTLTITGSGSLTAQGGWGAAGIGTGLSFKEFGTASNECGAITIAAGVTSVTAKKSSDTPGPNSIGKGDAANGGTQTCGTITIGGTVYWDGSDYQNDGNTYLTDDITYEP